jgi:hypothetical protein
MNLNHNHVGHTHFWMRPLSRRQFLGTTAGVAGAFATSPLWMPSLALSGDRVATVAPKPIGIGVSPFGIPIHHFPPTPVLGPTVINEPSQITDFNGFVGITRVRGTGTGTDTTTGATHPVNFQVDNGFMDGVYVGEDGKVHRGTFAFV